MKRSRRGHATHLVREQSRNRGRQPYRRAADAQLSRRFVLALGHHHVDRPRTRTRRLRSRLQRPSASYLVTYGQTDSARLASYSSRIYIFRRFRRTLPTSTRPRITSAFPPHFRRISSTLARADRASSPSNRSPKLATARDGGETIPRAVLKVLYYFYRHHPRADFATSSTVRFHPTQSLSDAKYRPECSHAPRAHDVSLFRPGQEACTDRLHGALQGTSAPRARRLRRN